MIRTKAKGAHAMRTFLISTAAFAALLVLGSSSSAQAQNKQKRAPKVIQLEEIKIEGRVQKPNAFYILNRSNLGYEVMDLRTSFVRDVVRAVNGDAF
ncbi:MAG TPA: hypothetical protein VHM19_04340 [Polyangiales bacterium]|nr:hypothetical protein [Polyangiales bacterium]